MELEPVTGIVPRFANRAEGGLRLARMLRHYRRKPDTLVVGVARGGLIAAAAVAGELALPLDVLVICRLETPGHQDLTMGAIGPDDVRILDRDLIKSMRLTQAAIVSETQRQWLEFRRRQRLYRDDRLPLDVFGKNVIVVDDGIDSGATINVALSIIHRHHAASIVVAVPVAPPRESVRLRNEADAFLCLYSPEPFFGIRYWYGDYSAPGDQDVLQALARCRRPVALAAV